MHIIIAGYGRVGGSLGHEFEARGHTVAVVDREPAAFEEFDEIRGRKIVGEAFDRKTLERAGIAEVTPDWSVGVPVGPAAGLYQAVSARCDLPALAGRPEAPRD
jgi:2-polyprenyl-6-methoxyphenol hydroxylase-like FAD-dependent oxidoreductase